MERYVSIALYFSIFRNNAWAPAQASKGKLFDKPLLDLITASNAKSVEALYSLKVQNPAISAGYGANLWLDVFRLGNYIVFPGVNFGFFTLPAIPLETQPNAAVHVGRAVFDGRFSDLELNNFDMVVNGTEFGMLAYAQTAYGPDAQPLLPLSAPDPDLAGEPSLIPFAGTLATVPANATGGTTQTLQLNFTSATALGNL